MLNLKLRFLLKADQGHLKWQNEDIVAPSILEESSKITRDCSGLVGRDEYDKFEA